MTRIVDTETGAVLLDTEQGIAELPPLRTGEETLEELRQVYWRMELVSRLLAQKRKEMDGYTDRSVEPHEHFTGLAIEYEEYIEQAERELWKQYKDGSIERWPGESTRVAIAVEKMKKEAPDLRAKYKAKRTEIKNLEAYQKTLETQMDGLRSLLSYYKQEAGATGDQWHDRTFQPAAHPTPGVV